MKYVGVVGSRSIDNKEFVFKTLDYYLQNIKEDITIVSGGAIGCDKLASEYAKERGYGLIEYLPDYKQFMGAIAPLLRNTQIIEKSDILIAITTGSNGTADSIRKAEIKGIPVRIVKYTL